MTPTANTILDNGIWKANIWIQKSSEERNCEYKCPGPYFLNLPVLQAHDLNNRQSEYQTEVHELNTLFINYSNPLFTTKLKYFSQ